MVPREQAEEVRRYLSAAGVDARLVSPSEIAVPAAHEEVGDIVLRWDGAEVTIDIGRHFHAHFESDETGPPASEHIAGFILEFMAGRSVLTAAYSGSHLLWSRVKHLESGSEWVVGFPAERLGILARVLRWIKPPRERTCSFRWSGPMASADAGQMEISAGAEAMAKLSKLTPEELGQLVDVLKDWIEKRDADAAG